MTVTVTEPGVYPDLPEDVYHADTALAPTLGRSLSQSGAKTLLRNPARFAWERDHGRPPKDAYDLGSLAHALILRNPDNRIRVADTVDWRQKAWQEWKRQQHEAGLIPVHRDQLRQASRIAQAVRRHALAGPILAVGRPEVSVYAVDPETTVTLRARIDWAHPAALADVKTAGYGRGTADVFGKSAADYDYPMQAAFYQHVWRLATGKTLPFVTVTVETDPPYFVTVGQYSEADLAVGYERMRQAIEMYAELESTGGYEPPTEIVTFNLPGWYRR